MLVVLTFQRFSSIQPKEVKRTNSRSQKDIHAEAMKLLTAKKAINTIKEVSIKMINVIIFSMRILNSTIT